MILSLMLSVFCIEEAPSKNRYVDLLEKGNYEKIESEWTGVKSVFGNNPGDDGSVSDLANFFINVIGFPHGKPFNEKDWDFVSKHWGEISDDPVGCAIILGEAVYKNTEFLLREYPGMKGKLSPKLKGGIMLKASGVPALQGFVEENWGDADQKSKDDLFDKFARDDTDLKLAMEILPYVSGDAAKRFVAETITSKTKDNGDLQSFEHAMKYNR